MQENMHGMRFSKVYPQSTEQVVIKPDISAIEDYNMIMIILSLRDGNYELYILHYCYTIITKYN